MGMVRANANHYLVTAQRGQLVNHGVAGRAFLWPGSSHVLVPCTKQEASFAMTQETADGVPLRFKGIVIYRVTHPEQAAQLFSFSADHGREEVAGLISHICLGELRAMVAHMSMAACIAQRKTTLTEGTAAALKRVVHGDEGIGTPWGIEVEVLQVAQVFIIDAVLRQQLDAEVRNGIRARSELSDLQAGQVIAREQIVAERALEQERLESERSRVAIERERLTLQQQLDQERADTEAAVALRRVERAREVLSQQLEQRRLENALEALALEADLQRRRAEQQLRMEILPLEQVPAIAEAIAGMLQGTNLSLYGSDFKLLASVEPLVQLLGERLRGGQAPEAPAAGA